MRPHPRIQMPGAGKHLPLIPLPPVYVTERRVRGVRVVWRVDDVVGTCHKEYWYPLQPLQVLWRNETLAGGPVRGDLFDLAAVHDPAHGAHGYATKEMMEILVSGLVEILVVPEPTGEKR